MITFLLSGLWHGASWNYVLWGLYHGVLLVLTRAHQILHDAAEGGRAVAASRLRRDHRSAAICRPPGCLC